MRRKKRKLSKKEVKAIDKQKVIDAEVASQPVTENQVVTSRVKKPIEVPKIITVRDFAVLAELPVTRVISELMKNGVMASINESIDFETAQIVGDELWLDVKIQKEQEKTEEKLSDSDKKKLSPRPPIIVVMGHVDHGKTKLLDAIRKTDVVATESGGITQHIGAYQVKVKSNPSTSLRAGKETRLASTNDSESRREGKSAERMLTFLDTPGHEAFSAMRAHGANITDIVILVVAADDGVKPQTKEAISHAKSANVPIIVAINKIDKPEADIERVKRQLADLDLNPEEWGGKTTMVPISAKNNQNIDKLMDMIILTADMEDLKAIYEAPAEGVVIESHMQAGVGAVATILVQKGTLKTGDAVMIGQTFGKIRLMEDYRGKKITIATPSMPVKISGIREVPNFGDSFKIVLDEKTARNQVAVRTIKAHKFGLVEISEKAQKGETINLNIILKADTQGSLTAIKTSLESLTGGNVKVKIINEGVGDITESDINMAAAGHALVLGFKVKVSNNIQKHADDKNIKINSYDIIYNLIDDIQAALQGLIKPEIKEVMVGKLEVLKVFHSVKDRKVIGGKVVDGKLEKGLKAHIYHSGDISAEGKIESLHKEQNEVPEVERGFECGMGLITNGQIKPGDVVEAYKVEETFQKITK